MRFCFSTVIHFALLVVGMLWSASASAEELAYRDGDGNWRWVDAIEAPILVPKGSGTEPTFVGVFRVTYGDLVEGTGVGFDNPSSGAVRRATLHAVLGYLSSVLDVPGTADLIILPSQTDGGIALAAAGPIIAPRVGFQGGLVFEHLTTGIDPMQDSFDGTVGVDFGFAWNSDADETSAIEYDLYTALLHEVTHALGFFSAVAEDARSQLLNVDDAGLFSFADSFLVRASTETPLFLEGGVVNAVSEDVQSQDLLFNGPLATAAFGSPPPVFAPALFLNGSSISHWDPSAGPDAVMQPVLDFGDERRVLAVWELQMLADLGYPLAPCVDIVDGADDCVPPEPIEPGDGNVDPPEPTPPDPPPVEPPPVVVEEPVEEPVAEPEPDSFIPPAASSGCGVAQSSHGLVWLVLLLFGLRRHRRE